ncbi:hypothetical protein RPE78_08970 [Thioclava litoralis]|uniref:Uncharacterized protein n=1 Tax=Thioclava litoralis TaxID=3076557 RepID=A0ABZ1DVQ1_9RHOB|nr:hypothetical protein RPE78_08970 [Thioclava sp. FTW29]
MLKIFVMAVGVMATLSGAGRAQEAAVPALSSPAQSFLERLHALDGPRAAVYAGCCKTCHKGKACGNSCISRSKQCHKGVGCACDG